MIEFIKEAGWPGTQPACFRKNVMPGVSTRMTKNKEEKEAYEK